MALDVFFKEDVLAAASSQHAVFTTTTNALAAIIDGDKKPLVDALQLGFNLALVGMATTLKCAPKEKQDEIQRQMFELFGLREPPPIKLFLD